MTPKKNKEIVRVIGRVIHKDHEVWRVTANGKTKSITTRRASIRAMDEAMEIYGQALQRLANR